MDTTHLAVSGDIKFGSFPFIFGIDLSKDEQILIGKWEGASININKFGKIIDLEMPEVFDFDLNVKYVTLQYSFQSKSIKATLDIEKFAKIIASIDMKDKTSFSLEISPNLEINLGIIPIVGDCLDGIVLKANSLKLVINEEEVEIKVTLSIGGEHYVIPYTIPRKKKVELFSSEQSQQSDIYWIRMDKSFGVIKLNQIGAAMINGKIIIYFDAGFYLSIIRVTFYELHVSISMKLDEIPKVGLSGLAISLDKPPLKISGGLYRNTKSDMYTGELALSFTKFSLALLASYGILPDKTHSMFAYLLINAVIGGPPFLLITGLAVGFGVNRSIKLPEKTEDVINFPFVAAAMGDSKWSKVKKPDEMLKEMNTTIVPEKDQYFISAGIRFSSFGFLDTFILANVAFGNAFSVSVLGLSVLSVPPKVSTTPIAFAQLAIKSVYSPDNDFFYILASLTNNSYIFSKECKLTGSFAFYSWFKGEHANDFVVSIGGYHPRFPKRHYPDVNRLAISWKINSNLSLTGYAYFALTPNALMAGGGLSIVYHAGNLKAWLNAYADFLIQWKPFHYVIDIGISIGASYRIDFLFIHTTFTIELSAKMHIAGPEFSGWVKITWFIISFTIKFGEEKEIEEIGWTDFRDNFLSPPSGQKSLCTYMAGANSSICNIYPNGVIRVIYDENQNPKKYIMKSRGLSFEILSRLPCTKFYINDGVNPEKTFSDYSIRPMKVEKFNSKMRIELFMNNKYLTGGAKYEVILQKAPPALWGKVNQSDPLTEEMLTEVPMGITIIPEPNAPQGKIPKIGSYAIEKLMENEDINREYIWQNIEYPERIEYTDDSMKKIKDTINKTEIRDKRNQILNSLKNFELTKNINVSGWSENQYLFAPPILSRTGSGGNQ